MSAPQLHLVVGGTKYGGWKTARVTRSIESVAGSFDLGLSSRWANQPTPVPVRPEDDCKILIQLDTVGVEMPVITGSIDRVHVGYGAQEHSLTISGRDRAGLLVDCSAHLGEWEFHRIGLLSLAQRICKPHGIAVAMQPGLKPPVLPAKLSIDPGESSFEALERACRMTGILPVSDGLGGLLLTRAGSRRATTALVEGQNILSASARYDVTGRYRTYLVTGQHPGSAEFSGDQTAAVRGSASDPSVRRSSRVLVVRAENATTPALATKRARWEASVRAARAVTATVVVQGWTQGDGTLWPTNAVVPVRAPHIGVDSEMLISEVTHSIDDHGGMTTELHLKPKGAFSPQPLEAHEEWYPTGVKTISSHKQAGA